MRVKKAGGKVFGADLTAAERKAMNLEIQRQLAEYDRKHANELDAIILWQLHAQFGFGAKRLKRFYNRFKAEYFDLVKRYELDEGDNIWLCTYIAEADAARSTCLRRQYGAVIVADDEIIATGYNGAPRGEANCCDVGRCYCKEHSTPIDAHAARHGDQYGTCVAVHAEQNAIISAPRRAMRGATLYLACLDDSIDPAPCNICDRMIKNAGITRVVTRAGTF